MLNFLPAALIYNNGIRMCRSGKRDGNFYLFKSMKEKVSHKKTKQGWLAVSIITILQIIHIIESKES